MSRTGFYIVGIKLLDMSTKQAEEFYGPVKDFFNSSFDDKFKPDLVEQLKTSLKQKDFSFELTDELLNNMAAQKKKPKVMMNGKKPYPKNSFKYAVKKGLNRLSQENTGTAMTGETIIVHVVILRFSPL